MAGRKVSAPRFRSTLVGAVVCAHGHQVGQAVAVDVRDEGLDRLRAGVDCQRRLKGTVAVADEHARRVVISVGGNDVEDAVARHVGDRDRRGMRPRLVGFLGLERAVADAHEHAHGVIGVVGGDDVKDAVAGQVRDRQGEGLPASGERFGRTEACPCRCPAAR